MAAIIAASMRTSRLIVLSILGAAATSYAGVSADDKSLGDTSLDAMLARDKALELPTPYVPPPGNPLEHHAAGFAQIMCSGPASPDSSGSRSWNCPGSTCPRRTRAVPTS